MKIELENCQKSLTLKDFEEIESKLGYALPERLKEFYLHTGEVLRNRPQA